MNPLEQIKILEETSEIDTFANKLRETTSYPLCSSSIDILQINVGKRCNLSCKHCHVEAGPERVESMAKHTFESCLAILENSAIGTIDITGGAPEMNEHLPWFIEKVSTLGRRLIVRSNLVILLEDTYNYFIDFYAKHNVELVGSLPDYRKSKSDRQRGDSNFDKSIAAIRVLNEKGYGKTGSNLILDLVHNPVGAYLPGTQSVLEFEYRRVLEEEFGIKFNSLFCLSNCPVGRYLEFLLRTDNYDDYMSLLAQAFNPIAANTVMCRNTLSVGWNGTLYDCDFNQMLELPVNQNAPSHIDQFDMQKLKKRHIVINNHCYACTAGAGSSCQGSLENR